MVNHGKPNYNPSIIPKKDQNQSVLLQCYNSFSAGSKIDGIFRGMSSVLKTLTRLNMFVPTWLVLSTSHYLSWPTNIWGVHHFWTRNLWNHQLFYWQTALLSLRRNVFILYIYNTYILYCRCHFRCSTSVALHCIAALYQTWQRHISIKTPLILARETISQPGIFSGISNILQLSFGGILQFETNILQHLKEGCNEPTWVIVEKWE